MNSTKRMLLKIFQFIAFTAITATASAQLKADFSASPVIGCPPMIVDFKDVSTGSPTSWKWDLGNGTTSFEQHPKTAYFDPGIYTVRLVVKNASGADSVAKTRFIIVNAPPNVRFKASDSSGCFPLRVKFTDSSTSGSGTISTWQWDFGDGTLSATQSPTHTYINAGSFTVTLRVVNTNGCVKVYTKPNFVNTSDGVKANFSFASASGCKSPTPVTFTNTSEGTGTLKYSWTFGDGNTSTQASPINNYIAAGSYTVKLVATSSFGCADSLIIPKAINVGFVKANFTSIDKVCAGSGITFTNTSAPNTIRALWDFGDGTTSTNVSPIKSFATPGTYQVKLVNDFGSCKDSIVKSITIIGKPTAAFTATNTAGCTAPLIVNFQNTSTNGASYKWNFGDGTTSTVQSTAHTYGVAGTYSVTLIVTNSTGCTDTIVQSNIVKIIPPKITTINYAGVKGCIPLSMSPEAVIQSAQVVTSYKWDFGDGFTSTLEKPSHTYTVPGVYPLKLIIVTGTGCTDSFTIVKGAAVGEKPTIAFSALPRDVCAEIPVVFTDESTGPVITEWFWTFGDGGASDLQNPKHIYSDTGKFTVSLTVFSYGCIDTLKIKDYIHISPPIAKFDTAFTCGDRLTRKFIDKSIGATSWQWDFGDGTSSTESSPTHTYAASGLYTVVLTVSNGSCQHSKRRDVKVVKEVGRLTYSQDILCRNARVVINADGIDKLNISKYTWYFNGLNGAPVTTTNTPVAQIYTVAGTYPVTVITSDIFNCKDTMVATVPIKIYGPKVDFNSPVSGTCFGTTVTFSEKSITDNTHPIDKYIWSYGDGKVDTLTAGPFTHKFDSTGVFNVMLTIVDNYGCRDSINRPALITVTRPIADFTLSDSMVCPNIPITITNNSSGGLQTNYLWDFSDGQTSTLQTNQVHTYPVSGNYTIKLNMVDKIGCKDSLATKVKVFPAVANFRMSDSFSTCPPLLVNFTNLSKNFVGYSWDFGDGGKSTLDTPSHLYTYPGTYTVKLWVNNNGGCSDTLKKTVTIQGPTGSFKYDPIEICSPREINFIATTKNAVKYFWDFSDGTGNYSASVTAKHTYVTPGKYVPKMILEDASGCPVPIVGPDTIKVDAIKTNILAQTTLLCDSGYVSFADETTTNDAIGEFLWDFGDGTKSTERTPKHSYQQAGLYSVKLTATSKFGCVDSVTTDNLVKIVSSPKIDIAGNLSACEPAILNFNGSVLKADTSKVTWSWDMGNGEKSDIQNPGAQTYPKAGDFPVKVTVVNSSGCTTTAEKIANIHPLPVVDAGPDTLMCKFTPINLMPSGADTYTWDFDPSLSCLNCTSPAVNPADSTMYMVTGKTVFGCVDRDSIIVKVKQPFKMTIGRGDTLCVGRSFTLKASGAQQYQWSPSTNLDDATSATPKATPDNTITYQVIGKDDRSCFADTGSITLKVYPIPQITINGDSMRKLSIGAKLDLTTNNSADITKWRWMPSNGLSCADCPNPIASPKEQITYSVQAANDGGCLAQDNVTVTVICDNSNVYVPNTFSPNGDGQNDYFYVRGNGVFTIKSFKIFNRWGQVISLKHNLNANVATEGWDGTMNGVKLTPDVYVYCIEVTCQNNVTFPIIGNVTLVR